MIESPFALDKFIESATKIISPTALSNIQLGINIETINAYKQFKEISKADGFSSLYNVTVGRVDFVNSMKKDRSYVNSSEMLEITTDIFTTARELGKKLYVGGAVTAASEEFFKTLYGKGLLDKFETRYVIYDPAIAVKNLSQCLIEGQKLELDILRYRQDLYYRESTKEDARIEMISKRVEEHG